MGCNRVLERIAAATGNLKAAPTIFQTVKDVPNAGVLCALPSLLENGIIKKIHNYFKLPDGFYSLIPIAASRNQIVGANWISNTMVYRKQVVRSQESEFSRFFV